MQEFSTVDGFVEITESLAEMIKYVANEPSVGLFYVQQHTQNAVPNVINLKDNITEKSRETILHTEDLEDSIAMVKAMKGCGFSIADEMIRDVKISLATISAKQPRRGLIHNPISGSQMERTRSWGPSAWGHNVLQPEGRRSGNYISSVFQNAKERATNFKWPQLDLKESTLTQAATASTSLSMPDMETDELPLSSQTADELQVEDEQAEVMLPPQTVILLTENFDEFKADKEAKLEEWLGDSDKFVEGK